MSKRILFVSHNASRSGAPILLLRLLRWLRANTDYQLDILVLRGGPLEADFYQVARPVQFTHAMRGLHLTSRLVGRPLTRANIVMLLASLRDRSSIGRAMESERYDLIYANTAASGFVLKELKRFGCPVVTHVHELQYALDQLAQNWKWARKCTDHYIAVSRAVSLNLETRYRIDPGAIDVAYGFIDKPDSGFDRDAARRFARQSLGLAPDTFLVGGSGTIEWRKGTDLFVQMALSVLGGNKPADKNVAFAWVGGNPDNEMAKKLAIRIQRDELDARILFVRETPDPRQYFAAFDLFALTSREDPFPLVCLESGALGVPTLCFEGCGGIPELLERGGGSVVPGLSPEAMAAEIRRYAADPDLLAREGEAIRRNVLDHHTVDVVAPQIAAIIDRLADQTP